MRILLIDVDSRMANLALMKISAWHKFRGDRVYLNKGCCNPDLVYISCIFSKNRSKALGMAKMFNCPVEVGGYGVNDAQLPPEIEHVMPDYSLYSVDYSLGFTSRGCIRKCSWCLVPEKEGWIRDHAPITEFLHPNHDKLVLLDNNFLASPKWRENLQFLIDHGLKVSFCQGLDIRLINEENAGILADINYWSTHFKRKYLYFAFDLPSMEEDVRRGVHLLNAAGIKSTYLRFYMLVGFSTTFEQDVHRFQVLKELGVEPFVMKYNGRTDKPLLNKFARWVNKQLYKKFDFWDYNQKGNNVFEPRRREESLLWRE